MRRIWKNTRLLLLPIALVGVILSYADWVVGLETAGYDMAVRFLPVAQREVPLVTIGVEDENLPLLDKIINRLTRNKAAAVGIMPNLNLPQTSASYADVFEAIADLDGNKERNTLFHLKKLNHSEALQKAIERNAKVVLGQGYREAIKSHIEHLDLNTLIPVPDQSQIVGKAGAMLFAPAPPGVQLEPVAKNFVEPAKRIGFVRANAAGDRIRDYPLIIKVGDRLLPGFALQMLAQAENIRLDSLLPLTPKGLKLGKRLIPVAPDLKFYPPPLVRSGFEIRHHTAKDVLAGKVGSKGFAKKLVLIGRAESDSEIRFQDALGSQFTPLAWQAQATAGLLSETGIRTSSWFHNWSRLAVVLACLYLFLLPSRLHRRTGLIITAVVVVLMLNLSLMLFLSKQLWVPVIWPGLLLLATHSLLIWMRASDAKVQTAAEQACKARMALGQNLQSQGRLDQALEEFDDCAMSQALCVKLYDLGQDFERRRLFNKALAVYERIAAFAPTYSDIGERLQRLGSTDENMVRLGITRPGAAETIIATSPNLEKPMLGRYRIEHELGRGSMGIVYLGIDPKIGRKVAIKTLAFTDSFEGKELEEIEQRFFREAKAVGRLDHPNVVTIYDVGEEHDLAYIAMDFLEGQGLDNFISPDHLLPVDDVLKIGAQIADALEYAHQQQVVHRDVKPGNIIYDGEKEQAKITDFGIACLTDDSKTRTGTVLGSPSYMSPEQVSGSKVDGRSDIYSLGVTLYQLLTGRLPFAGDSMANLMYRITHEKAKSIKRIRPELSTSISRVIARCLSKTPEKRYSSAKAVARALTNCIGSSD